MHKMSSPNQSLTNGKMLAGSPIVQNANLTQAALKGATNARPLKLRRVNHTDEIVFNFSSLLRNESMTDVTLICNGGQTIRAHRVILSTFSPYFRTIFESQPFSNNPCQYPVIVIKDLEISELRTIIDFIYKGEVSVSRDKLQSVLQAAKALEVSGLADLKLEAFGANNSNQSNTNGVNTLLANSLMNNNSNQMNNLNNDSDQMNFGSLSALNYVCNLNGSNSNNSNKRAGANSLNNSMDSTDLFQENELKRLRVSIDDSNELLNSLGTSLLGENSANIDGVRSLLQQPPRLPQALQQLKQQQAHLNQFQQFKQRQLQMMQQRQQIQQRMQNQQHLEQLRQIQQIQQKNKYSVPKNNTLQGQQFAQLQEKVKQQLQEKQQSQKSTDNILSANGKSISLEDLNKSLNKQQQDDEPEIIEQLDNGENGEDKLNENDGENDLMIDDENNNEINKLEDEQDDKKDDDKNEDLNENGNSSYADYDENGDSQAMNGEGEEEYEIELNKDIVFQRQQQIRLEQLQKQAHFQQQFNLMQIDDADGNRNLESNIRQLLQASGVMRNGTNDDITELNNGSRRNSSKDSLIQTSSASGSEDTDNDNNNDNTLDINDNLSIMDNNFFDDYNVNLTSQSPIPMQVKLDPQLNRIPQTPSFLLPRGPGRPRKGNKGSDIKCHKKFVTPDVLKLHYRSVHLLERHPCNMCKKVFKWPGDLSKHKRKSCRGNQALAINRA